MSDVSVIPALRRMLDEEQDLSRRLTIAGTLWRLGRDEIFVDLLAQIKTSENATLRQAHLDQALWLADERVIDLLCDLLDDSDSFVRYIALSRLNEIEFHGQLTIRKAADLPRQPADYRGRRYDTAFRKLMVDQLAKVLERRFRVL